MESRELVLDAVSHRETRRIPHMIRRQPAIERLLLSHYGTDDADAVFEDSVAWLSDRLPVPVMEEEGLLSGGRYTDDWGVEWYGVGASRGQVERAPLVSPSLDGYAMPQRVSPRIVTAMTETARRNAGKYRVVKLGALWEQATFLRGMEPLLLDLHLHPGFVHDLLEGILRQLLANLEVFGRELDMECVWLSDDYGSQRELLISPEHWRTFVAPRLLRLVEAVRLRGLHFVLHSDGNIAEVLPDIVDMGVDLLNPVQPECMDVHRIKKEYGSRITLWGGYGTQGTLMFGTPDEVRREVFALCDVMAEGGGFILEPGLGFPDEMPLRNAVAFIEAAREWER